MNLDFCEKLSLYEKPLEQLCKELTKKGQDAPLQLVEIFGRLQDFRILQSLEHSKKEAYRKKIKDLTCDICLILKYNFFDLKKQNVFQSLPNTAVPYSWSHVHYLDARNDLDFANKKVSEFIISSQMPLEMAKVLEFHDLACLKKSLGTLNLQINQAVNHIFSHSKEEADFLNANLASKEFFTSQQMLVRYAAQAEYPHFISWIDEILCWLSKHSTQEVNQVVKQFKLCILLGINANNILKYKNREIKNHFKFNSSFQHYLIQKTLDQITAQFPLSLSMYGQLVNLFEKSDDDRRLTSFYLYILKGLFSHEENKNLLIKQIHLAFSQNEKIDLFEVGHAVLKRLTVLPENNDDLYRILEYFLYLTHFVHTVDLTEAAKELLMAHLLTSHQEDKNQCCAELKKYAASFGIIQSPKVTRLAHLKETYENYYMMYPYDKYVENILEDWKNFKTNETHLKFIQQVELFIGSKISLKMVYIILIYPIFLPKVLDLFPQLEKLRNQLDLSPFFLPAKFVSERDSLISKFFDPQTCMINYLKNVNEIRAFNEIFPNLVNRIQLSILPDPFPNDENACFSITSKAQNVLSFLSPSSDGLAFISSWHQEGHYYPEFELTILASTQQPKSRRLNFTLEVHHEILKGEPLIEKFLSVMLRELCSESRLEKEEIKIDKQEESDLEEFNLYLKLFKPLRDEWQRILTLTNLDEPQKIGLLLLKFVKQVKIAARQSIASLTWKQNSEGNFETQNLIDISVQ